MRKADGVSDRRESAMIGLVPAPPRLFAVSISGDQGKGYDVWAHPVVFIRTDGWDDEDYETDLHKRAIVLDDGGTFDVLYTGGADGEEDIYRVRLVVADWPPSEDRERFLAIARGMAEDVFGDNYSPYRVGHIPPVEGGPARPWIPVADLAGEPEADSTP
jgi:hypothetical protein